jgi:8-oxo-dGTP pyrophosphatase MutT (NUDIX family)
MTKPEVQPRPASTMLLLRQKPSEFEIFMMVRHDQIDFASGALVFPGGSVDASDKDVLGKPELFAAGGISDPVLLGLRVAAIRETFEESGILLARPFGSNELVSAERASQVEAAHRGALCEGKIKFADILAEARLVLALDLLVPYAHWITPAGLPKRFDTHFFLALAPADQVGAHDGKESVDSVWVSPRSALEGATTGRFKLLFPTTRNLIKLGKQASAAQAIASARSDRIVTVLPQILNEGGRRKLKIPAEAGYDGDVFDMSSAEGR